MVSSFDITESQDEALAGLWLTRKAGERVAMLLNEPGLRHPKKGAGFYLSANPTATFVISNADKTVAERGLLPPPGMETLQQSCPCQQRGNPHILERKFAGDSENGQMFRIT